MLEGKKTEIHNQRMELYMQGLSDREIGKRTGCTGRTIQQWRHDNNLRRNYKSELDGRMQMYKSGMTDGEIGRALGVRNTTIEGWRKRHGLPCNSDWWMDLERDENRPMTQEEKWAIRYGYHKCGQSPAELAQEHARPVAVVEQVLGMNRQFFLATNTTNILRKEAEVQG